MSTVQYSGQLLLLLLLLLLLFPFYSHILFAFFFFFFFFFFFTFYCFSFFPSSQERSGMQHSISNEPRRSMQDHAGGCMNSIPPALFLQGQLLLFDFVADSIKSNYTHPSRVAPELGSTWLIARPKSSN